jgi:hypothetical protein
LKPQSLQTGYFGKQIMVNSGEVFQQIMDQHISRNMEKSRCFLLRLVVHAALLKMLTVELHRFGLGDGDRLPT